MTPAPGRPMTSRRPPTHSIRSRIWRNPKCPGTVPDAPAPAAPRVDLSAGAPDLSSFPARDWLAAMRTVLRDRSADALDYAGGRGHPELHAALVDYLARARDVTAVPAQMAI